jgi:hypothetical protein
VSFRIVAGEGPLERTSVQWAASGVCALVWCCSCSHPPGSKNLDSNVGLFRNVRQAGGCEFQGL